MLEVVDVGKRFGSVVALDGVGLSLKRGQVVGFLGPNGAGKSTTMRAVMGLIAVDHGTLTWDDRPITAETRYHFGYMPAERGMYPKMTVRDQLVYFARLAGRTSADAARSAQTWMERVDIAGRADDEVQALSSGNQQRVQLAISLVHEPELLILDEPFSGLDPVAVENMKDILREQTERGAAVLFSSHQLDLVSDVSRDVVIINAGRVVLEGDVRAIREQAEYRYATIVFGGDVGDADDGGVADWSPTLDGVQVLDRDSRSIRLQLPADTEPQAVLAAAARAGRVVEFSLVPPDLSEVFLAVIS
jgi:ABC-2 type transport system ATP-binding protein